MSRNRQGVVRLFAITAVGSVLLAPTARPAVASAASPCPAVQVVFARGTNEPPGVGDIGQAFIDSVQSRVASPPVDVYPVDYPASTDFPTAARGVVDASTHVRNEAAQCPDTKMILAGYSQGAAVIGYVTADAIPEGYVLPPGITGPMPPGVAKHVKAVALFGEPSERFLNFIDAPPIVIGALYVAKTINECIAEDVVCSPTGSDIGAHHEYASDGLVDEAADLAVQHLRANGSADPSSR